MKKQFTSLVFAIVIMCCGSTSFGQMVGPNCFLQGHWLEIGIEPNASFGPTSSPATYHPHPAPALAMVYDYGHDGWGVGTPQYMGDYTFPGYPQEGWAVQINGSYSNAYQPTGPGYSGPLPLTGGLTTYVSVPGSGKAVSNWAGTAGTGLVMKQETRLDTNASWVVVTTYFHNTTGAAMNNVFYMRTCDPDNDVTWPGGGFVTTNVIVHQNDVDHRVQVSAVGATGAISYMALGTKDCRAKAFSNDFGLTPITDLAQIYNQTGGASGYLYALGGSLTNDMGYGLIYKLGTIAAGDSTIISYAYIFNGNGGIDDAFPEPLLVVNGIPAPPSGPAPAPTIDTFDVCSYPGMTSFPVDISFAEDKCWSWSSWTWSPAIGLSATTGAHVVITSTVLPPVITYTITGTDSAIDMYSCNHRVMYLTIKTCNSTRSNAPCVGDSLYLSRIGDSTGCTYFWSGPGGFTSTDQYTYRYPTTLADSGMYYIVRNHLGSLDTDSTYVTIHPRPILNLSSNSPLCAGMTDTLRLFDNPFVAGYTFSWTGPSGFSSTLQNPTRTPFTATEEGTYTLTVKTPFGCTTTDSIATSLVTQPDPPIITNHNYCQGEPFTPFVVTHIAAGGVVWWYPTSAGGAGTTIPSTVSTAMPGRFVVWANVRVGSCVSGLASDTVRVTTTPGAPPVTGPMEYCQFIGPVVPLIVTTTATGHAIWYTSATGGPGMSVEPLPNINTAGTFHYWVSQIDSTCEGPRTPVTIIIHPKPAAPVVTPQHYCQFKPSDTLKATGSGGLLTWFGHGIVSTGSTSVPTPQTDTTGLDTFYVNETSSFGCVSDMAIDTIRVIPKPAPPFTTDTTYCQYFMAPAMNVGVDSAIGSTLTWFTGGGTLIGGAAPVPNTAEVGNTTWYVNQTVNTCVSEKVPIKVTILYKPVFTIAPSSPWLCQHDSITLAYDGPVLVSPYYTWTLPPGAKYAGKTNSIDSQIYVEFDSATKDNYVHLHTTNYGGRCYGDTVIRIKVIELPTAVSSTRQDVCLGDTVTLAISAKTPSAANFIWKIDYNTLMANSNALNIIAHNSNSGGPFSISWNDTGSHVIQLTSFTEEGCTSKPTLDSIFVHAVPDASFNVITRPGTLCLEDSVKFEANTINYNFGYQWTPVHFFSNENKPSIWGKVEQEKSIVTLLVTDPFGCYSSTSQELDPNSCCTISFPNAFTPNGDGKNDVFRPIRDYKTNSGFHRYHTMRVANRWGQTVFESSNNNPSWDGTYNQVPQDMGVYYYFIKFDCGGKTIEQSGDVTLIR